jgi:hypothetical protein
MKHLLCVSLLFLCTPAMAEIPEGGSMDDDVLFPTHTVSESHKNDCKITCTSPDDFLVQWVDRQAVITGCGDFKVECGK